MRGPREGWRGEEERSLVNGGWRVRRSIIQRPKQAYWELGRVCQCMRRQPRGAVVISYWVLTIINGSPLLLQKTRGSWNPGMSG
jgi:hypothetical protein